MDNLAFLVIGMIGYGTYNAISNRSSAQNGGRYDDLMDDIEVEDAEVLTNDKISMYLNISKQPKISHMMELNNERLLRRITARNSGAQYFFALAYYTLCLYALELHSATQLR